ncbi:fibropellin-3-like [Saccostrea echinata]|uniref:fibropellin-3-like n=1 Tax=Saccostrea echinata TaxID=191078 RepID=UPI002A807409|nr:fibropellin-3-like [Saccostrea echinata]
MQASKMFLVLMIMYAAGELSVSLSVQSEGYCTNCDPNPCLNGGTCDESTSHTGSDYKCYCPQGFSGETCEFDVCDSHDCQNGTCEADESNLRGYRCNCVTGYIGNNCDVDVCDDHDCRNGDCEADQSSIRGYRCKCVTGYIGDNCEVDVCGSNVCQNGGSCEADKSQVRGFTCICINDYVGDNCEGKL